MFVLVYKYFSCSERALTWSLIQHCIYFVSFFECWYRLVPSVYYFLCDLPRKTMAITQKSYAPKIRHRKRYYSSQSYIW